MPTAQALTSGLNAGTNFANLQRNRQRDAFDQQQKQVENYSSIVGNLATSLEKAKAEFEAKLSTTSDLPGKQKILGEWKTFYEGAVGNVSRAGQTASDRGVPIDAVAQVARLTPFENLRDLSAEVALKAIQEADAAGKKAGAVSGAKQEDALERIRATGAEAQKTKGITSRQDITTTSLTTRVEGDLQTGVISNSDRIARLTTIRKQIEANSSFLTVGGKTASAALNILDKFGVPIPEKGEEFLIKQSKFVRDSIENINNYIKEITGAQMSEKEATRLRLAQPDPGEDIFSGDGPVKFKAKLEGATEAASLAQARAIYFLEKGITHDFEKELAKGDKAREAPISISGMKSILNDKGREEARIIRAQNPEMPIEEVLGLARENVQRRFGMAE